MSGGFSKEIPSLELQMALIVLPCTQTFITVASRISIVVTIFVCRPIIFQRTTVTGNFIDWLGAIVDEYRLKILLDIKVIPSATLVKVI